MTKVGNPQKTSCIVHPADDHFIMIRNDYMRICESLNGGTGRRIAMVDAAGKTESFTVDGAVGIETLRCAAALLNYFESWTNHKIIMAEQTGEPDFWVWNMSARRIATDLLDVFPVKNVAAALDWLTREEVIDRRSNEKNTLDKSHQYMLNVPLLQNLICSLQTKNTQNPDAAHAPSRENGSTLQGQSIHPPGETYKIQYSDSLLDSEIRSVSTASSGKHSDKGIKQGDSASRCDSSPLDANKIQSMNGKGMAPSASATGEVKRERQTDTLTSPNERIESATTLVEPLEDECSAAAPKLQKKMVNGALHTIDVDGIVLLPTTGKNRLAGLLALKTAQVWLYSLLDRCEVYVEDGRIWCSDLDEADRPIEDLKSINQLTNYAFYFDCCLNIDEYNEALAEFFSFWVDWIADQGNPLNTEAQELAIIDLLELES
jgi:hypothetical protein